MAAKGHPCVLAFPFLDGQSLRLVVPVETDAAPLPLLVVGVAAFVLIEGEGGVGAGIDGDGECVDALG